MFLHCHSHFFGQCTTNCTPTTTIVVMVVVDIIININNNNNNIAPVHHHHHHHHHPNSLLPITTITSIITMRVTVVRYVLLSFHHHHRHHHHCNNTVPTCKNRSCHRARRAPMSYCCSSSPSFACFASFT